MKVLSAKTAIRHALLDFHTKGQLIETPIELDMLMESKTEEIVALARKGDQMLNEKQVAEMYPFLTVRALQNLRHKVRGPKYFKFGKKRTSRVFYKVSDIEAWIIDNYQRLQFVEEK